MTTGRATSRGRRQRQLDRVDGGALVRLSEDVERRRQFIEEHALEVKNLDV